MNIQNRVKHKNGNVYVSSLSNTCKGCAFEEDRIGCYNIPVGCYWSMRIDGKSVIWILEDKNESEKNL